MSDTCGCNHTTMNAVDKIRRKGYSNEPLPNPFNIACRCGHHWVMKTHEAMCPSCHMVYGVTPCSNTDQDAIEAVGVRY